MKCHSHGWPAALVPCLFTQKITPVIVELFKQLKKFFKKADIYILTQKLKDATASTECLGMLFSHYTHVTEIIMST